MWSEVNKKREFCILGTRFLVEYLATQTGGATVNNIFEVRFTYTKMSQLWTYSSFASVASDAAENPIENITIEKTLSKNPLEISN